MRLFFGGFTKMTSQEKVAMAIDDLKREALFLPYVAYLKPVLNRRGSPRFCGISILGDCIYYSPELIDAMTVIHVKAEIIAWALPQIARELMGKGVMQ